MQETASETVLEALVDADVLVETGDGIALTDEFHSRYERQEVTGTGPSVDPERVQDEERVRGYVRALRTFDVDLTDEAVVAAAVSLDNLTADADDIVSVRGEALPALLDTVDHVIVLVSKDGCEACDTVRSKLDGLVEDGVVPADVVIAEVHGPECKRLLWENYDVVGAPTLLFGQSGGVELRLTGDPHVEQLRSDVQRVYA